MKKNEKKLDENLRHQAETKLSDRMKAQIPQPMSDGDSLRLIHELQVHQIELEMQNEQLIQTQVEVERGSRHYADLYNELYDFAPVGYFTLGRDGMIQGANLTGAQLLGVERGKLIKRRFGAFVSNEFHPAFTAFLKAVFESHEKSTCEVEILQDGQKQFWAHLEAAIDNNLRETCRVVMVDITERKQVEIELQNRKKELELINKELAHSHQELETALGKYSDLYDFAPVGYLTLRRNGTILQSNLAGASLLGLDHKQLTQYPLNVFVASEYRHIYDDFFEKLLSGEGKKTCELAFTKNRNELLWARLEATCFEGSDNCRAMLTEITERKLMEQALQESENRFRILLQDVPSVAVQGYAMDGTTQYWNTASEKLYGYSAQEAIGRNLLDLIIPPETREGVSLAIQRMAKNGEPIPAAELSLMRKDGSRVAVYSSHASVSVPGCPPELFCLDVDLTARKQAEEALRESETRYRELIELAADGILIGSHEGIIIGANSYMLNLTGRTLDDLIGKHISTLFGPNELESAPLSFELLQKGETVTNERNLMLPGGNTLAIEMHTKMMPNRTYQSIYRDITERKRAESILQTRVRLSQFADSHSLDELLQKALDEAEALTGSNIGFFHFLMADQKTLELQTWSTNTLKNMCTAEGKGSHYSVDEAGVWVECIYARAPVIHNDYANLPYRKGLPAGHAPILRELVVPILRDDLIVMLMGVGNKPTDYDDNDIKTLSQLADSTWDIVQRKRVEEALRLSEALLNASQQLSKVGGWEWNIEKQIMTWTDETYRIHDFVRHEFEPDSPDIIKQSVLCYDPQDRPKALAAFQRCIEQGEPYDLELPFTSATGTQKWIRTTARAEWKGTRIVKVIGNIMDITERKQTEDALRENQELFSLYMRHSPIYTYIKEVTPTESRTLQASDNFQDMVGISSQNMIGKTMAEIFPAELAAQMTSDDWAVVASNKILKLDETLNGRHFTSIKFPITQGGKRLLAGYTLDVTERVQAEEALKASEFFIKGVLNSLTAHIAVMDGQGTILDVNEAWKKFAQENGSPSTSAYVGTNYLSACQAAIQQGDSTAQLVYQGIRAMMDGSQSQFSLEYPCHSPTQQRWFTITVAPLKKSSQGFVVTHQNITERKQIELKLEVINLELQNALTRQQQLAHTDSLTGINNRRHLYELAEHEFEIALRYQQPFSILMFDIDHFKRVNDTFGHAAGDRILQQVTQVTCAKLRSADVIGRYGGEEFVVILPMTNAQQAYQLAERIRTRVAAMQVPTEKRNASVTLSIGIVELQHGKQNGSIEELIRRADEAMYAAKQAGRNQTKIG